MGHRYGGGMVVVCVVTLWRLFKLPSLTLLSLTTTILSNPHHAGCDYLSVINKAVVVVVVVGLMADGGLDYF